MSIIRTYFDKNNTILSGIRRDVNTGRNPVAELFYGDLTSRFIFYVDLEPIRALITEKSVNVSSIVRHTLKMKNSSNFDVMPYRDYRNQIQFGDKTHATSFDLELKPITEFWDEGIGYDADRYANYSDENPYLKGASNWVNRTKEHLWEVAGAVSTNVTISMQHFDKGSEDLELDITDFINGILMNTGTTTGDTFNTGSTFNTGTTTGDTINYMGFCLKFTDYFESLPDPRRYVSFFSRHTHTFFEPFIETEYNDIVKDDRRSIILDKTCNLVFYVYNNGNLFNLDNIPRCSIKAIPFPVTQISKGIYNAEILLPSGIFSDYVMYHDTWSDIVINGVEQPIKILDITPKPSSHQFQLGTGTIEPVHYGVSVSGIKRDETVTQGENRKVIINLRKPHTISEVEVTDNIYYRLYVKQGINQITVIDWTEANRSFDSNYFYVDTSWLVPQQYFMDIKTIMREETHLYNEELKFSVVSQLK